LLNAAYFDLTESAVLMDALSPLDKSRDSLVVEQLP
jgi:hypothetical protein